METGPAVPDFGAENWVFGKTFLAEVSDAGPGRMIGPEDLTGLEDCEILLIRTGFERYRSEDIYWQDSPGLRPDLALHLKRTCPSIRAVGADFISVSSLRDRETGRRSHRSFLENDILLIEDMKLSPLVKAPGKIIVAPLLVEGADGSPCTVFAMEV
jgi:kynurenine formamidase